MYLKFGDQNLSHKRCKITVRKCSKEGPSQCGKLTIRISNVWINGVLLYTNIHKHNHAHTVYTHTRTRSSYLVCCFMLLIKVTKFWKWLLVVGTCFTCSCGHICFSLMNTALTQKIYCYLLLGQKTVEVIPFGIHQRISMKNKD